MEMNKPALISKQDLSKSTDNLLNENQLQFILKKTPSKYIKKRPAKGGGEWEYVSISYVTKSLNIMFGWNWDFEIMDEKVLVENGEVIVKGKLTCNTKNGIIVKSQYGNKDIVFKKNTKTPLSIGNDLKSAASDSLKKCASLIGVAQDVYSKEDFREVIIDEVTKDVAKDLAQCHTPDDFELLWASLSEKEQQIYKPIFDKLS
jgi:hypothetical protein